MLRKLIALAPFFLLLAGCVGAESERSIETLSSSGARERIPIAVLKPDGAGPFPAIVVMHDCSGLGLRSSGAPNRWADELVRHGYVVAIPDSFTTRGHAGGVCTVPPQQRHADTSARSRAHDAYAALAYLRALPYVDGQRVGIIGGSHGGSTVLATMAAPSSDTEPLAHEKHGGFAAAVALYPACPPPRAGGASPVYKPIAPVLILIGEKDDWTPAEPCRTLVDAAAEAGHPLSIKIYPGALHAFDSPYPVKYVATRINQNAPGGRGATTGGDASAWAESIHDVEAFFDRYLMPVRH